MAEPIQEKMRRSLQAADDLYHRLVLLVGKSGSGKTCILRDISEKFNAPMININLTLSCKLLELTAKQRSLQTPKILGQIANKAQSLVVLDNLGIFFDKNLKQDPLRLLQGISRDRVVVASWSGASIGNKLWYAEMGHPEYRSYDSVDALIVNMDGTATVDLAINDKEVGQA